MSRRITVPTALKAADAGKNKDDLFLLGNRTLDNRFYLVLGIVKIRKTIYLFLFSSFNVFVLA